MSHLLTAAERARFLRYCQEEAYSYGLIVEQMVKSNMPEVVIKRNRLLAGAYMAVANHLGSAEEMTIGPTEAEVDE